MIFQLLVKLQLRAVWLIIKGGVNALLHLNSPLSANEYNELWSSVLGMNPKSVVVTAHGIRASFFYGGIHVNELNAVFFHDIYGARSSRLTGKIVMDAGANVGIFSIFAAKLGAKKVFAFEPVKETFMQLKRNISLNGLNGVVVPVNMALGDGACRATISYEKMGDASASIAFFDKSKKMQRVRVATLDSFMKGKGRADFIKIDAEGYEAKILSGAKNTIKKCKPILSFSAYHKPEDKTKLPKLVHSIRKDYHCVLHNNGEEDFYCE